MRDKKNTWYNTKRDVDTVIELYRKVAYVMCYLCSGGLGPPDTCYREIDKFVFCWFCDGLHWFSISIRCDSSKVTLLSKTGPDVVELYGNSLKITKWAKQQEEEAALAAKGSEG